MSFYTVAFYTRRKLYMLHKLRHWCGYFNLMGNNNQNANHAICMLLCHTRLSLSLRLIFIYCANNIATKIDYSSVLCVVGTLITWINMYISGINKFNLLITISHQHPTNCKETSFICSVVKLSVFKCANSALKTNNDLNRN